MSETLTCPVCGGAEFRVHREEASIRADDGTMLPYTSEYSECTKCGEEFLSVAQTRADARAALAAVRAHAGLLSPAEIRAIREQYGITQVQLEQLLNAGKKSVVRWEAGRVCQSRAVDQLLRQIGSSPALFAQRAAAVGLNVALPSRQNEWAGDFYVVQWTSNSVAFTTLHGPDRRQQMRRASQVRDSIRVESVAHGFAVAHGSITADAWIDAPADAATTLQGAGA